MKARRRNDCLSQSRPLFSLNLIAYLKPKQLLIQLKPNHNSQIWYFLRFCRLRGNGKLRLSRWLNWLTIGGRSWLDVVLIDAVLNAIICKACYFCQITHNGNNIFEYSVMQNVWSSNSDGRHRTELINLKPTPGTHILGEVSYRTFFSRTIGPPTLTN